MLNFKTKISSYIGKKLVRFVLSPQETFLLCTLLWALIFSQQRKEDIDINVKLQTKNIFLHRQQTISILPASTDCYRAIDIHTFSHLHFIAFVELPSHKRVRQFITVRRLTLQLNNTCSHFLARATCSTITLSCSPGSRWRDWCHSRHTIFQQFNSHVVTINIIMSNTGQIIFSFIHFTHETKFENVGNMRDKVSQNLQNSDKLLTSVWCLPASLHHTALPRFV